MKNHFTGYEDRRKKLLIGLTGGIGSGKSTVSSYLKEKNYDVIDADEIARNILDRGTSTLSLVVEIFGKDILFNDGSLNRKKLGEIIFSDSSKKKLLEEITHKKIFKIIYEKIQYLQSNSKQSLIFLDAPLLFETDLNKLVDVVFLVDTEDQIRIDRVVKRDGLTRKEIMKRIDNQMSREDKIKKAEEVINNSVSKEELYHQIDKLLEKYE